MSVMCVHVHGYVSFSCCKPTHKKVEIVFGTYYCCSGISWQSYICPASILQLPRLSVVAALAVSGDSMDDQIELENHSMDDEQADQLQEVQPGNNKCCARVSNSCAVCTRNCLSPWSFFYGFCFLTGQYINFEILSFSDTLVSVVALTPFVGQLIVYLGYVATAFLVEGFTIANVSLTVAVNTSSTDNDSIDCMLPQEHWKFSTAVTISAIAAIFSYGLMTSFVLIFANVIQCEGRCTAYMTALRDSTLSPYNDDDNDDDDDESSNLLSTKQTRYFFINYVVVLALFFSRAASSIYYATTVYDRGYCWINTVYLAMIVLQLNSHFCAIHSCFIFSKIIYKVTNKLNKLATDMEQVNFQYENRATAACVPIVENDADLANLINSDDREEVDRGRYYWLQKLDQNFIQQVKPILDLFGVWFIFHWTLYALTTVLLSAFIIQIITEVLQYNFKSVNSFLPNVEADTKAPYVSYVVFFTLVHAYLFLYPCVRAAVIATARAKLINNISENRWLNIPLPIQISFVQYLTSKKFAFRVPLFCASIPIEFNWVFVSFLVPILVVYLAL